MRFALFAALVAITLRSPALADTDNGDEAEPRVVDHRVVEQVLSAIRENYRPLRAVKARISGEIISNYTISGPPAPVPVPPNAGTNPPDVLTIYPSPPKRLFEWTAHFSGENQRYDIPGAAGRETISADLTGVTQHIPGNKKAIVMPWTNPGLQSMMQFDPREAGFISMAERLSHILTSGKVTSARLIERSDGDTIAEIKAASVPGGNSPVIECSSKVNFLPTRVSYFLDDNRLSSFTDVTYQQVRSDPAIWFLKTAVRRNSFPHKNTSPDDKQWAGNYDNCS